MARRDVLAGEIKLRRNRDAILTSNLFLRGGSPVAHLSQLAGLARQEAAPELHRGQKVCPTWAILGSDSKAFRES
jgi:hypothetical protein